MPNRNDSFSGSIACPTVLCHVLFDLLETLGLGRAEAVPRTEQAQDERCSLQSVMICGNASQPVPGELYETPAGWRQENSAMKVRLIP